MIIMQFGLSLPLSYDINQLIALTRKAEEVGFDYAFMPDHILSLDGRAPLNVWSVLNVLAVSTNNIGLGSMVANVYRQHPSTLRQQVYTLKRSMGERKVMIGLGTGMIFDCDPVGIKQVHPINMMRENLEVILKFPISIIIGAYGPKMKRIASEFNGWVPRHALSPSEFLKEKDEVKQYVRFDYKDYLYIADVPVSHINEPWLWKTLAYRYLLQTKYRNKTFSIFLNRDIESDSCKVGTDTLRGFSAIGSTDEIIGKLQSYIDNGANMFSIRYYGEDLEKFSEVMEYFRE